MSDYVTELNDISDAFNSAWGDRIPVAWPNVNFDIPDPPAPWCRFNILNAASSRMTIGTPGTNRVVNPGRVVIQFFSPRGTGEVLARQHLNEAADIFRALNLPGYRFFTPSIGVVASSIADPWYQINLDVAFQRDEFNG